MRHGRVDDALGGELERPQQARERRCRGRRRVELAGGVAGTARQCRDSADPAPLPSWPPPTSQSSRSAPQNPVRCGRRSLRKGGAALKSCGVRTDPRPARPDSRPRWAGRHSCHRRGRTGSTSHLPGRVIWIRTCFCIRRDCSAGSTPHARRARWARALERKGAARPRQHMGSAKKERAQTKRAAKQVTGQAGPAGRGGRCVLPHTNDDRLTALQTHCHPLLVQSTLWAIR